MMNTKQAFTELTSERNWYKPLNIHFSTAAGYIIRFKRGELSTDKIEEILTKAGYIVKQEKLWQKK
ncbi:MAG: hypothetical protein WBP45_14705 [Daejeonella sp.]